MTSTHHRLTTLLALALSAPALNPMRVTLALSLTFVCMSQLPASAAMIFTEDWESPTLGPGGTSSTLPADWNHFSGQATSIGLAHPDTTNLFDDVAPLAGPAGGNQYLFLAGVNTGVYRMSGAVIEANTLYTLSAAIGNAHNETSSFWSLQLWSDTDGSGVFEGSFNNSDTFIGQQFGTNLNPPPDNPAPGGWALNSFSFDSSTRPDLIGQELIVFLNNFDNGTSSYDNVTLSSSPVPEPSSLALFGLGSLTICGFGRRRRCRVHCVA